MTGDHERQTLLRIVDANFNRSQEAFRVLEEYARFILDDRYLTERLKQLRHQLAQAFDGLEQIPNLNMRNGLWVYRNTPGDVGTCISATTETYRSNSQSVLQASANRLSQSLRAIEEYGKVLSPDFSMRVEKLRYESYTAAQQLIRRASPIADFRKIKLYVLITEALCRLDWFEAARQALEGGAGALQLREKELSDKKLLERAKRLRELCSKYQAILIINDRPDIALAGHADGVHLGQNDLPIAAARRILGPHRVIGWSTHSAEQAQAALADAPDYLAVGPMFASSTKPNPQLAGPETLQAVRQLTSLPLVAIGGIKPENAPRLKDAEIWAVSEAVIGTLQPEKAVKELVEIWNTLK